MEVLGLAETSVSHVRSAHERRTGMKSANRRTAAEIRSDFDYCAEEAFRVTPFGSKGSFVLRGSQIQCHVCGEFFEKLGNHIIKHGMYAKEYKKLFGLHWNTALASESYRAHFRAWAYPVRTKRPPAPNSHSDTNVSIALDPGFAAKVADMRARGCSLRSISKELGVSNTPVMRALGLLGKALSERRRGNQKLSQSEVADIRLSHGLSQTELARRYGVSRRQIGRILKGA